MLNFKIIKTTKKKKLGNVTGNLKNLKQTGEKDND